MQQGTIDRLAITIVDGSQSRDLIQVLNTNHFPVTVLDAIGGFLHEAMVTMLIGLPHNRLPRFFALIREHCPRRARYWFATYGNERSSAVLAATSTQPTTTASPGSFTSTIDCRACRPPAVEGPSGSFSSRLRGGLPSRFVRNR